MNAITKISAPLRISELAAAVGVDSETIRYYEKTGLLPPPARSDNGYRAYGQAHVQRLAFIRHCRSLDIPLADIQQLLTLLDDPKADGFCADTLLQLQIERVRTRLHSLHVLEKQLMALLSRCNADGQGQHSAAECPLMHELVVAAQGEACACHGAAKNTAVAQEEFKKSGAPCCPSAPAPCGGGPRT